uniref:Uncharacterized protein n=1 Tax=Rhizophora mucronata TaxID=61149 RepID=A0A2P2NEG5_RHIMU
MRTRMELERVLHENSTKHKVLIGVQVFNVFTLQMHRHLTFYLHHLGINQKMKCLK